MWVFCNQKKYLHSEGGFIMEKIASEQHGTVCLERTQLQKHHSTLYFFFIINFLIVSLLAKWPCLLGLSFVLLKVLPKAQAPRLFRELSEKPRLFPNKCHFLLQKQELFLPFVYPSTFLTSFALVHLRTEFSHITLAFSEH